MRLRQIRWIGEICLQRKDPLDHPELTLALNCQNASPSPAK
jgi:hypothetical protein